jgi:hypothetical protein
MKTDSQIQAEIEAARLLTPFYIYPKTIECWNEYEVMWRTDNGRSYNHVIEREDYRYHLLYFDDKLATVEVDGVTIFSHLLPGLELIMQGKEPEITSSFSSQKLSFDRLPLVIQQRVKSKHDRFPIEVRPYLEYKLDGNLVMSISALDVLSQCPSTSI